MAANRQTPSGSTPTTGSAFMTDVREEIIAAWGLIADVLSSVSGTNAITASSTVTVTAYTSGLPFWLVPANNNTGAVTINIDSVGLASIVDRDGNALAADDLVAGRAYLIVYISGKFRVMAGQNTSAITNSLVGADVQTFDSTGTWTPDPDYPSTSLVFAESWGSGGGGGASSSGPGGGGGAYNWAILLLSLLTPSQTATVGASAAAGATGATSQLGSYVQAFGGGRGENNSSGGGGGGGGIRSIGANGNSGTGGNGGDPNGATATTAYPSVNGGGKGGSTSGSLDMPGGPGLNGGGGGGGTVTGGSASADGGAARYGGGGGGGKANGGGETANGGTSTFGGNGGTAAAAGSQPGGGGGRNNSSGAGRVRVTTFAAAQGPEGATGATGETGGAIVIPYVFDTTTTVADPGAGKLRLNAATQNAATAIIADLLDGNGSDRTSTLDALDDSSAATKGYLRIHKASDPSKYLLFSVTAVNTASGYRNITASIVDGSAASPFANADNVVVTYTPNGTPSTVMASDILATDLNQSPSIATVQEVLDNLRTAISAIGASGVTTFNGRSGAVVPVTGDYNSTNITNSSSVTGADVTAALNTLLSAINALVTGVSSVNGSTGAVTLTASNISATDLNNSPSTTTIQEVLDNLRIAVAAGGGGGVTTFESRSGAVVSAAGDYVASEVTNDSSVSGAFVSNALNTLQSAINALVTGVSSVNGSSGAVTLTASNISATDLNNSPSTTTIQEVLDNLRVAVAAIGASGVTTFEGRSGTVTSAAGDYVASEVTNDSSVSGAFVSNALNTLQSAINALVTGVSSVNGSSGAVTLTASNISATDLNNSPSTTTVQEVLDNLRTAVAAIGSSGVTTFEGRSGTVISVAGDYAASEVTNDSSVSGSFVSNALNTLQSAINALVTGVSSVNGSSGAVTLTASNISATDLNNSPSTTTVQEVLDNLRTAIAALVTGVSSFNSRTGAVVPATNDYTSTQISNSSSVSGTGVTGALNTLLSTINALVTGVSSVNGSSGAVTLTASNISATDLNQSPSTTTIQEVLDNLRTAMPRRGSTWLVDGATPALDASLGDVFRLVAAGDRTIAVPTGSPYGGQKIIIAHYASGGSRTMSLNTGVGGFRFGTDITGLTATTSGKWDYVGAIYNDIDNKWDVVAYSKGY